MECSEDAIIATSLDDVIERWNRGAEELFGYTADEAVGQPIALTVPAYRRVELERILARIGQGFHLGRPGPLGELLPYLAAAAPLAS